MNVTHFFLNKNSITAMHKLKHTLTLTFICSIIAACSALNCGNKDTSENGTTIKVNLPTIQCTKCKKNIEKALVKIDGINKPVVDVDEKILTVNFDATKTNQEKIEKAVTLAGYQANDKPADKDAYDNLDDCCKIGGHN